MFRWWVSVQALLAAAMLCACSATPESVETVASTEPTSTSTTVSPSTTSPAPVTTDIPPVGVDEPRWLTVDTTDFELISDTGESFAEVGTPEVGGILRRQPDGSIDLIAASAVDGSQYRTRIEASNGLAVEAVAADTSPDGYEVF